MIGNGNIPLLPVRPKLPHERFRKNTRLCVLPPFGFLSAFDTTFVQITADQRECE